MVSAKRIAMRPGYPENSSGPDTRPDPPKFLRPYAPSSVRGLALVPDERLARTHRAALRARQPVRVGAVQAPVHVLAVGARGARRLAADRLAGGQGAGVAAAVRLVGVAVVAGLAGLDDAVATHRRRRVLARHAGGAGLVAVAP